ncbi:MAG: hypothetical protein ACE5OS_02640 [Anaerolineae bacterium]
MTALTLDQLRWVAYALLIASAFLAGLAIPQFAKARRAPYYILRRKALRWATRWLLVALVVQGVAVIILVLVPRLVTIVSAPVLIPTATPSSTPTPAYVPLPSGTPTPSAMLRASATPTRRPTATPPLIPTPTLAVPLPDAALTPLPPAVPAGEDARIVLQCLALERDENGQPLEPGNEFPPGDYRVYLFFTYEGMQNAVATTFAWYKDGEFLDFCSDTWLWGLVEGRDWGESGWTSYFCRLPGGWEPGSYEIHVFIETRLQGIAQFVITEE